MSILICHLIRSAIESMTADLLLPKVVGWGPENYYSKQTTMISFAIGVGILVYIVLSVLFFYFPLDINKRKPRLGNFQLIIS